jgi:hypothetical protein
MPLDRALLLRHGGSAGCRTLACISTGKKQCWLSANCGGSAGCRTLTCIQQKHRGSVLVSRLAPSAATPAGRAALSPGPSPCGRGERGPRPCGFAVVAGTSDGDAATRPTAVRVCPWPLSLWERGTRAVGGGASPRWPRRPVSASERGTTARAWRQPEQWRTPCALWRAGLGAGPAPARREAPLVWPRGRFVRTSFPARGRMWLNGSSRRSRSARPRRRGVRQ